IGGTVVFGSNTSTAKQTAAAAEAAEARRAELIGKINLTVVTEQGRAEFCNSVTMGSSMNDEQRPNLPWTVGVLKGLLTGEDSDSKDRGYGRTKVPHPDALGPKESITGAEKRKICEARA